MILLLMRHGEAENFASTDASRSLTNRGREQVRASAARLAESMFQPEIVLSSPYVRARQTADIVLDLLVQPSGVNLKIELVDTITPGGEALKAIRDLAARLESANCGLVVFHQPIISRVIELLCGERQPMGTAHIAVLEATDILPGCCELKCVLHE